MKTTAQQQRAWTGPVILKNGFRLFFLMAGLWAVLAMVLWILTLTGAVSLPSALDPVSWHAHEFLWGYFTAVMAGFLLTAVPNWTGRLPVVGWPVATLAGLWLLGRMAVAVSAWLPPVVTTLADAAFLAGLAIVLGREIIIGRNWRNLMVVAMVVLLLIGNILYHLEVIMGAYAAEDIGLRVGLGAAVMLILLIGGRVTPSFTRNWMVKQGLTKLPASLGRFDQIALLGAGVAVISWIFAPTATLTAELNLLAGALNLVRLARWQGHKTWREPLVLVLHFGFGFTAIGFLSIGLAHFSTGVFAVAGAQHVWMVGGIGTMTLAMMTRASLGHSGRALTATPSISLIYFAIIAATLTRFAAGVFEPHDLLISIAGGFWLLAFGSFVVIFWPILVRAPIKRG
ncbi:MAG: NnrS family protein [Alphaproteobacteria bacterium]|nr:NnrS family protein [Alphaproteobacteria bacterium]